MKYSWVTILYLFQVYNIVTWYDNNANFKVNIDYIPCAVHAVH